MQIMRTPGPSLTCTLERPEQFVHIDGNAPLGGRDGTRRNPTHRIRVTTIRLSRSAFLLAGVDLDTDEPRSVGPLADTEVLPPWHRHQAHRMQHALANMTRRPA